MSHWRAGVACTAPSTIHHRLPHVAWCSRTAPYLASEGLEREDAQELGEAREGGVEAAHGVDDGAEQQREQRAWGRAGGEGASKGKRECADSQEERHGL